MDAEEVYLSRDFRAVVAPRSLNLESTELWDIGSWRVLRTLPAPAGFRYQACTAFSLDSRYLACVARAVAADAAQYPGGNIVIWDLGSGRPLQTLNRPMGLATLAFLEDGKSLVGLGWETEDPPDGRLRVWLWDALSGRLLRTVPLGVWSAEVSLQGKNVDWYAPGPVFSPDGRFLTARVRDAWLVWNVGSGRLLRSLKGSTAFSPDGDLVTVTARGLEFQDPASGRVLRTLVGIDHVFRYSFSRDRRFVATVQTETLRLWDAASGRFVRSIGPLVWPTILKTIREHVLWGVGILGLWAVRLTRLWNMAPAATKTADKGGPGIPMACHLCAVAGITAAVLCYEMAEYVRPGRGHDDWGPFFDVLFFGSWGVALW